MMQEIGSGKKKDCKVRTDFNPATLYFIEQTWLLGQFYCPSQTHPGA